ncbi:hypothetical protein PsYK624_083080 [Phanerochaete sordida]|uniref:Uncharacterized protein n=1 Tax=Phanerochaete sordida TaxID=48140 RepID=A0A9P3LEE1_9APHY|nr:hypothetical protein PsYK624_083080 [Phanerochaete sordida]
MHCWVPDCLASLRPATPQVLRGNRKRTCGVDMRHWRTPHCNPNGSVSFASLAIVFGLGQSTMPSIWLNLHKSTP